MKKKIMILLLVLLCGLLVGCGNKKEPTEISCKYVEGEDELSVSVEMVFKRDNKKKLITDGKLIMSYNLSDLAFGEVDEDQIGEDSLSAFMDTMFAGVCDNIGTNYKDCEIKETKKGADVIMTFNLTNLAQTSAGEFHRNMTIEQLKNFISKKENETDMICTTK